MPVKTIDVIGIGPVDFYKRRGSRNIRLTFTAKHSLKVTLPMWLPYKAAIDFVASKREWIVENAPAPVKLLEDGAKVGKTRTLRFAKDSEYAKITTQLIGSTILVGLPPSVNSNSSEAQAAAQKAAFRAMKAEAAATLPVRLKELAEAYGYTYKSVGVRQLKRRWGSCDSHGNITLNFFLVQLPDHLIDYVLLHELTHTKVMHHQQAFWDEFARSIPNPKDTRKQLREYKPLLDT